MTRGLMAARDFAAAVRRFRAPDRALAEPAVSEFGNKPRRAAEERRTVYSAAVRGQSRYPAVRYADHRVETRLWRL